jgi:AcrR family transcriptional regulator
VARTKAASFEAQRGAIRDAAARLFADRGYAAASIAEIAAACGVSKALLYHYYRDKEHLLHDIAESYVERLQAIVEEVSCEALSPAARMRQLITRFMHEYEHSAARHRVLVQDVKYLSRAHRSRIVARQRGVVDGFAQVIGELAPAAAGSALRKPLTMILFGMMNWTFTWFSDRGPLRYDDLAPVVADLFLGGLSRLHAVDAGTAIAAPVAARVTVPAAARRPRTRTQSMKAIA